MTICKECKQEKAVAIIFTKNVCERCFNKLKPRKKPFDVTKKD